MRRTGDPRRVVGYVRASTTAQRNGPEAQRLALAEWARTEGVELVAVFEDQVSGRVLERPGLMAALAELRRLGAGRLVAVRRDRLARDRQVADRIDLMVRRAGAEVVVVQGAPPGDSPEAQLLRTVVDAIAEFEVGVLRARTRAALRAKMARGEAAGGVAPYGYRIVGGRLVRDEPEQLALQRMQELHAQGNGIRQIGLALRREGYRPRGSSWHDTTVRRLLERAA